MAGFSGNLLPGACGRRVHCADKNIAPRALACEEPAAVEILGRLAIRSMRNARGHGEGCIPLKTSGDWAFAAFRARGKGKSSFKWRRSKERQQ